MIHSPNPAENFEISRDTRNAWLATRKAPATFAGLTMPGLFRTDHFPRDAVLIVIVVALELWGLACLVRVGGANPFYAVCFAAGDLLFAILRHLKVGQVQELRNRLVVSDSPDEIARI